MEVKIKNKSQIYNVCRLKKFTDPEISKFRNEENMRKHTVCGDKENQNKVSDSKVKDSKANELFKNSIERRVTRSMKKSMSKEE